MNMETYGGAQRVLKDSVRIDESIQNGNGRYHLHDELPGKVIRWEEYGPEIIDELPYLQQLLRDLEDIYDIPTVRTQFVLTANRQDDHQKFYELIMVNEKIEDAIVPRDALEAVDNPSVAQEFDSLSCKLLAHLRGVLEGGGVFMSEYCRYSQYVYSPSASEGKRLILVDTEPIYMRVLEEPEKRADESVPLEPLSILSSCALDIIDLEQRTGCRSNAHDQLLELVDTIPSKGHHSVDRVKFAISEALRKGDATMLDFLYEEIDSDWILFAGITKASVSVKELLRRHSS